MNITEWMSRNNIEWRVRTIARVTLTAVGTVCLLILMIVATVAGVAALLNTV